MVCQRCGQREATQGTEIFNIVASGPEARVDERKSELCDECSAAFLTWLVTPQEFIKRQVQAGIPLHQAVAQAEERFPRRTLDEFPGPSP